MREAEENRATFHQISSLNSYKPIGQYLDNLEQQGIILEYFRTEDKENKKNTEYFQMEENSN